MTGCPQKSKPKAQSSEACAADSDCVLTARHMKSCCSDCSPPFAVHRTRAAAIKLWHRKNCQPPTQDCPDVRCKQPQGTPRAKCKKRRCVTEVTLAPPKVKNQR